MLLIVCCGGEWRSFAVAAETCSITVAPGDAAVGIAVTTDALCSTTGGLGCIANSVCRMCKAKDTPQAQHLLACSLFANASPSPLPTSTSTPPPATSSPVPVPVPSVTLAQQPPTELCTAVASPGDASVGIATTTDTSCKTGSGGIGCFGATSVCRFCKTRSTVQSQHLVDCSAIPSAPTPMPSQTQSQSAQPAPTTRAPTPVPTSVSLPPVPTLGPSEAPASVAGCSITVSPGDAAVGLAIATDMSCTIGGLGCISRTCRFCRQRDTPQAANYLPCASLVTTSATPSPQAPAATSTSTPTPAPAMASLAPSPIATTAPPLRSTQSPVPVVGTLVQTPPADCCSNQFITNALATAGVWAVLDPACPRDGDAGDCREFCRLCKFADTSVSMALRTCANVLAAVAAQSLVVELAPLLAPASTPCYTSLALDDIRNGLWTTLVCTQLRDTVCVETRCDVCKYVETPLSAMYPQCDDPVAIASSSDDVFVALAAAHDGEHERSLDPTEFAMLVCAAVSVVAVVVFAAVAIARTVTDVTQSLNAETS